MLQSQLIDAVATTTLTQQPSVPRRCRLLQQQQQQQQQQAEAPRAGAASVDGRNSGQSVGGGGIAPAGWCSWYELGTRVTEVAIVKNAQEIAGGGSHTIASTRERGGAGTAAALADEKNTMPILDAPGGSSFKGSPGREYTYDPLGSGSQAAAGLGLKVVQLDDGYQDHIGDWLQPNATKFPRGLRALATEIKELGFTPGIWLAPFLVGRHSELYKAHPDWVVKRTRHPWERWRRLGGGLGGCLSGGGGPRRDRPTGPLLAHYNPDWANDGLVYVLDVTHPGVRAHLTGASPCLSVRCHH